VTRNGNSSAPAGKRILELRGLLQQLRKLTRDVDAETPIVEAVGVGRELWRFIDAAGKVLDTVKDRARDYVDTTPGRHEIDGVDHAVCVVVVPTPRTVLGKGLNGSDVQQALGDELFNRLFQTKLQVRPHKDFGILVADLEVADQKAALGTVDLNTGKPRVSFVKKG